MNPLSRGSQYAIRALTYMASKPRTQFQLTRRVARELGIPAPYLGKTLQPLVAKGILVSQRGRTGGVRLARAPSEITLHDIVGTLQPLDRAESCVLGMARCDLEHPCPLHEGWHAAAEAHAGRLRETTLEALIGYRAEHPECCYPFATPAPSARGSIF